MNNHNPNDVNSLASQGKPKGQVPGILRAAALTALAIGALGSLAFMFRQGQQTPRFLLVLFTIWVLSPFAILFWANRLSKGWSALTRATLYCVMLIVAFSSMAIYSGWIDIRPAGAANAFLFVAVPPISVFLAAIVVLAAAFLSGKRSHRDTNSF